VVTEFLAQLVVPFLKGLRLILDEGTNRMSRNCR